MRARTPLVGGHCPIDSITFGGVHDPQAADREFDDNTAQGFGLTQYMVPPGTTGPTPH